MPITDMTIAQLARKIREDWTNPYFGATPYLDAMGTMHDTAPQDFGCDNGKGIILYFLANANTWRGDTARAVKAELKRRTK